MVDGNGVPLDQVTSGLRPDLAPSHGEVRRRFEQLADRVKEGLRRAGAEEMERGMVVTQAYNWGNTLSVFSGAPLSFDGERAKIGAWLDVACPERRDGPTMTRSSELMAEIEAMGRGGYRENIEPLGIVEPGIYGGLTEGGESDGWWYVAMRARGVAESVGAGTGYQALFIAQVRPFEQASGLDELRSVEMRLIRR